MVLGGKMVWARAIRGFRLPLADRFAPLLSLTRGIKLIKVYDSVDLLAGQSRLVKILRQKIENRVVWHFFEEVAD